jgi:two-component system response regulator
MVTPKRILLAEDDPSHAELIARAIKDACDGESISDVSIDVVSNGVEAIDYLFAIGEYEDRQQETSPNLILLDIKMPKMSGLQVLQVLRRARDSERASLPPVIMLTSSEREEDISKAYREGAVSYLVKPLDYEQWTDAARLLVTYWLQLNHPPTQPVDGSMPKALG